MGLVKIVPLVSLPITAEFTANEADAIYQGKYGPITRLFHFVNTWLDLFIYRGIQSQKSNKKCVRITIPKIVISTYDRGITMVQYEL